MKITKQNLNRRDVIKWGSVGLLLSGVGSTKAVSARNEPFCAKSKTPLQPEGPFYPVVDQLDKDADLVHVQGAPQPAKGEVVLLQGKVLDQNCHPVKGALVEIWQACKTGKYNHPSDPNTAELDPYFQYWGKAVTDEKGAYLFRTIIPGAYPAGAGWIRPPHIHFKISALGYQEMITQMYFHGHPLNASDRILRQLPKSEQEKLIVQFRPQEDLPHPLGSFEITIERVV